MNESSRRFLEFNGKNIDFLSRSGQYWVAIKPICEALNVHYKHQYESIKSDIILGQLSRNQGMVAADGKLRKMFCLPEKYIYGWIFSLQSSSKELQEYKKECYDVLFNHFHGAITGRRQIISEKIEIQTHKTVLEHKLQDNEDYKKLMELNAAEMRIGKDLKRLDSDLYKEQLDLFNNG